MLDSYFTWNGVSSDSLGLVIKKEPALNRPKRKHSSFSVDGRNGDYVAMQDAFENIEQGYTVKFGKGFGEDDIHAAARSVAAWLYGVNGYARLTDSYEPDVFREAYFAGPLNIANQLEKYGTAEITFKCKPQRFLLSGEEEISIPDFDGSFSIKTNPTAFTSRPIIKVDYEHNSNGSGENDYVPPSLCKWWGRSAVSSDVDALFDATKIKTSGTVTATKDDGISITNGRVAFCVQLKPNTTYGVSYVANNLTYEHMQLMDEMGNNEYISIYTADGCQKAKFKTSKSQCYLYLEFSATAGTIQDIQIQVTDGYPTGYRAADEYYNIEINVNPSTSAGNRVVMLHNCGGVVYIDSENYRIYDEIGNNLEWAATINTMPELIPGQNRVFYTRRAYDDLTNRFYPTVTMQPRWWTL